MNDVGLFFSRVAIGAGIAAHGAQKAFGAFDGPGPAGAAIFLESLGFIPGSRFAGAAAWTEIASGSLIVLGLGGPAGPAALISTMVVAQTAVHAKNGFFAQKNGVELGVIYAGAAIALVSAGYGRFSLDETFGWNKLKEPWLGTLAVLSGVAAGVILLRGRVMPPATSAVQPPPDDGLKAVPAEAASADGGHLGSAESRATPNQRIAPPA